jgi:hypothetical protein
MGANDRVILQGLDIKACLAYRFSRLPKVVGRAYYKGWRTAQLSVLLRGVS